MSVVSVPGSAYGDISCLKQMSNNTLPCHPQLWLEKVVANHSALKRECVSFPAGGQ